MCAASADYRLAFPLNEAALYDRHTEPDELVALWHKEASRSETRGRDGQSPRQFAVIANTHSSRISELMRDGKYRFISYHQILRSRGATRLPRIISVPAARDRAPLKALLRFLHTTVPESRGVLAQSKVAEVARAIKSERFRHFIRIDVLDFYPSISHLAADTAIDLNVHVAAARELLKSAIRTSTLSPSETSKKTTNSRGIPQGLPISNALAELVLADFDARFKARTDIAYFRYVDDILIFTRRRIHMKLFKEVDAALREKGLKCHPLQALGSKSTWGPLSSALDYLGYTISAKTIGVRSETVARLKARLAQTFLVYKRSLSDIPAGLTREEWEIDCRNRLEWYLNISITGCVLDSRKRGWIHYFALINDFTLLRNLDYFIKRKTEHWGLKDQVHPKSFVSSYRLAATSSPDSSGYVPDFDSFSSGQQRELLRTIFRIPESHLLQLSDPLVEALFFRRLRRELDTLETDLAIVY